MRLRRTKDKTKNSITNNHVVERNMSARERRTRPPPCLVFRSNSNNCPALVIIVAGCLALLFRAALSLNNGVALVPPMGFNSYMAPNALKNEDGFLAVAKFFKETGMRELGYQYINTDEGWELKDRDNATGSLQWNETMFPRGLPALIETLHNQSFKFGIYGAASGVSCGVNPGQLYHEWRDAQKYADWGVDFVKSDNCASYALDSSVRFRALRDALNATGRRVVLSIEPFSISPDPAQSSQVANMWRTGQDIQGNLEAVLDRADVADKWAPLAGPTLGWNDPDMINVQNPPNCTTEDGNEHAKKSHDGLTLGENRIYFGLWAIMKAPLILSSNLLELDQQVIDIVSNLEVIRINQDYLGVPARKLQINNSKTLPWLAGVEDCAFPDGGLTYARPVAHGEEGRPTAGRGKTDVRRWSLVPPPGIDLNSNKNGDHWLIRNEATRRCLTVPECNRTVVLLPCDMLHRNSRQIWLFDKGVSTVTSITNHYTNTSLAIAESVLYSRTHGKDKVQVSDLAYGEGGLVLEEPYDQESCDSRWCENYRPEQMWYFSTVDGMLRHSLYTSSMNHIERYRDDHQDGFVLTPKVPTFRHHCLAHVLSVENVGTARGVLEVWGGPLEGGDFVLGLLNRGTVAANVTADVGLLLESSGYSDDKDVIHSYKVRDLWKRIATTMEVSAKESVTLLVPAHDLVLLRLEKRDIAHQQR